MKVVVLDLDHSHNQRVLEALSRNSKNHIVVCQNSDELVEHLNANLAIDKKIKVMQKTLTDGQAMLAHTGDGINLAQVTLTEKRKASAQLAAIAQQSAKAELEKEILEVET